MTTIHKSAIVPYSQERMYHLVMDVDSYHEFLPWCSKSRLLSRTDEFIEGEICVSHTGFNQAFSTRNYLEPNNRMTIKLLDGPFKSLQGQWDFIELDKSNSKISLKLDFEFKNKLVSMALTPVFSQMANSMVDSFCQRAVSIYQ